MNPAIEPITCRSFGLVAVTCAAMAFGVAGCGQRDEGKAPDPAPKKTPSDPPEMQWAFEIADSFLADAAAGRWDNAGEKVVKARYKLGPSQLVSTDIRDMMGGNYKPGEEFKTWIIESKLLSPEKDEASFRGRMDGPRGMAAFALLVQIDKDEKKWRVGDFAVKIVPPK